jgi:hypothetical protein
MDFEVGLGNLLVGLIGMGVVTWIFFLLKDIYTLFLSVRKKSFIKTLEDKIFLIITLMSFGALLLMKIAIWFGDVILTALSGNIG